jgi:hypothetical protein
VTRRSPPTRARVAAGRLRGIVPTLVGASAAIHLSVVAPHLDDSRLAAAFFVAIGLWQAAWAVRLVRDPSRTVLVTGIAGSSLILVVWALSRTTGLPVGPDPWTREAVGAADLVASGCEVSAILGSVLLLGRSRVTSPRFAIARTAMRAATVLAFLNVASLSVGGHEGHPGHALHVGAIGAAAMLFAVYLLLFVWVNGRPAFTWRLRSASVR